MHAEVIRHNRLLSGQGPGMRSWIGSSPIPNLTNSTQQAHMNDQWVITTLLAEAKVGPCRMGTIRKMTQLGAPESDLKVNAFGDIKREFGRETVRVLFSWARSCRKMPKPRNQTPTYSPFLLNPFLVSNAFCKCRHCASCSQMRLESQMSLCRVRILELAAVAVTGHLSAVTK